METTRWIVNLPPWVRFEVRGRSFGDFALAVFYFSGRTLVRLAVRRMDRLVCMKKSGANERRGT